MQAQNILNDREQFVLNIAIGAVQGEALQVNSKSLAAIGKLGGYEGFETPKEARETFIRVLVGVLAKTAVSELDEVCFNIRYNISVSVPAGWRSARAHSECVVLGGKGYVYKCTVADPPGSNRQYYSPEWWAEQEIGKAKIMSLFN